MLLLVIFCMFELNQVGFNNVVMIENGSLMCSFCTFHFWDRQPRENRVQSHYLHFDMLCLRRAFTR